MTRLASASCYLHTCTTGLPADSPSTLCKAKTQQRKRARNLPRKRRLHDAARRALDQHHAGRF